MLLIAVLLAVMSMSVAAFGPLPASTAQAATPPKPPKVAKATKPAKQPAKPANSTKVTKPTKPTKVSTARKVAPRPAAPTTRSATRAPMSVRGADISSLLAEEDNGATYTVDGTAAPLERILATNGATYVRIRLWVNPTNGDSTLTTALAIARRATAAGLKVFLDLHYSDWWADPSSQQTPAAWAGQPLPTLVATVRAYTSGALSAFAKQGTPVSMVEIGNEIDAGILWPTGRVKLDGTGNWSAFAELLNAGITGARAVTPGVTIVLHTALGSDNGAAQAFYDHVVAAGVTGWDAIGLSYYPYWQADLAALQNNLDRLAARYGRPVLIVETSYPWTLADTTSASWVNTATTLPDGQAYPATESGQAAYYTALRNVVRAVPDGRGLGLLVWEPGWLPGVAAVPGRPTPAFANLTLFDAAGHALPAVSTAFGG